MKDWDWKVRVGKDEEGIVKGDNRRSSVANELQIGGLSLMYLDHQLCK